MATDFGTQATLQALHLGVLLGSPSGTSETGEQSVESGAGAPIAVNIVGSGRWLALQRLRMVSHEMY